MSLVAGTVQRYIFLWGPDNFNALDVPVQGIVRRIRMLEIVAGSISFSGPRLRTAAQQGIAAIDGLHRLLLPATQDSTPQGMSSKSEDLSAMQLCKLLRKWLSLKKWLSTAVIVHMHLDLHSSIGQRFGGMSLSRTGVYFYRTGVRSSIDEAAVGSSQAFCGKAAALD